MTNKEVSQVASLARVFRSGIERCRHKLTYIAFADFPHGACGDASDLLGSFFLERGHGHWEYVCARRLDKDGHDHAWLEKEGIIVDVTADHFAGAPASVIVGRNHSWHENNFAIEGRRLAGDTVPAPEVERQLLEAYKTITHEMSAPTDSIDFA